MDISLSVFRGRPSGAVTSHNCVLARAGCGEASRVRHDLRESRRICPTVQPAAGQMSGLLPGPARSSVPTRASPAAACSPPRCSATPRRYSRCWPPTPPQRSASTTSEAGHRWCMPATRGGIRSTRDGRQGIGARLAAELARRLPARAWQRLSAGPGAKGPRWYDWAFLEVTDPAVTEGSGPHWFADPPPDQQRRARLLPGPRARPGAAGPAGAGGWFPVEDRGRVRRQQRTRCFRRASGPDLDILAPVDHLGPARLRVLVRPGRQPAQPPPAR